MRRVAMTAIAVLLTILSGRTAAEPQLDKARARAGDLRFGSYATSRHVERLATDEVARDRGWETIQRMGITRLFLEVYRAGHVVSTEHLVAVRDWLREKNIDTAGGIATVPGGDFGVRQEGPLGWFNWQNEKTQRDLKKVIHTTAGIFDVFIIDDFLCTGDVSDESKAAKGQRDWGTYRRQLLTELSRSVFVDPARKVSPRISMIVKYPQWYDRFHLFGYDTETFPEIFDRVWVGTETRGAGTRRFGFVQPYEGFVNYRWLAAISGRKIGGAWFDHGDCAENDFLDQAYMSVLAGAPELTFFNFDNLVTGHPDHEKVVAQFGRLADLAAAVRRHPVVGVPAYKPPNSEPAGDMYVMDFLGMLGIPLVPVCEFPGAAPVVLLPAQAAADPDLLEHVTKARARGVRLIFTTSLLTTSPHGREFARMAGIKPDVRSEPLRARIEGNNVTVDLASPLQIAAGPGDVVCSAGERRIALLATSQSPGGRIAVLNTHTYSQGDFDAVGEVLLCPRPLGLLNMSGTSLATLRAAFDDRVRFTGPSRVTVHPLADGSCVLQNFNAEAVQVTLKMPPNRHFTDAFSGGPLVSPNRGLTIPGRSRVWICSGARRSNVDVPGS